MSKTTHQVKVKILNNSESFIGDSLYLSGTFNNWEEQVYIGKIPEKGEHIEFDLGEIKSGDLELKLTRGDWNTLSSTKDGKLEPAFVEKIQKDTEIDLTIEAWRDQFPKSTASKQVNILDDHFFFPELNVYRKVMIYLPRGYSSTDDKFPVIYMHDGQHLFDEAISIDKSGPVEWMVDETLDEADKPSIVIAIDHAKTYELRQQEYLVTAGHGSEKAQGWAYLEDIVKTLKPFVDKNYRTLSDPTNTAMVGSSIGGLLTLYAGLKYPSVFGTLASFSPSIWMDEENLYEYATKKLKEKTEERRKQDFYFYIGDKERRFRMMDSSNNMKLDLEKYFAWMEEHFDGKLQLVIENEGKHGAIYWQEAFRKFYDYWQNRK